MFECLCYSLIPSTNHKKAQPQSTPCVFLRCPSNQRVYMCFELSSRKIIISRHIIFDETYFSFAKTSNPQTQSYEFLDDGQSPYLVHHFTTSPNPKVAPATKSGSNVPNVCQSHPESTPSLPHSIVPNTSTPSTLPFNFLPNPHFDLSLTSPYGFGYSEPIWYFKS